MLDLFHPATQTWFARAFAAPTAPQLFGWPHIAAGDDTLIAAPTGSGKTLTAFLACVDELFRDGLAGRLTDQTRVIYVSPLKALTNDIEKNLREPLRGIAEAAGAMGLIAPAIRVGVRTGDTTAAERLKMAKVPPHILVTTPESRYIVLTADKSRERLRHARTVIVDEIHAVAKDKRGAHLALTLERLDAVCGRPLQRIGLSATQRPVELVARYLAGAKRCDERGEPRCKIVDLGHLRRIAVDVEIPPTPLQHVCSTDQWAQTYDRLVELIKENRTTLIFVNTRSHCERLARQLEDRLGVEKIGAHHGSMSRAQRLKSEEKLKAGELSALVATSSLELGIDIGTIDLVCQLGTTASIGALLQRAGRAGHNLASVSRARLFPQTIDDLCTCSALASSIRNGAMDILEIPDQPRDILAQQIVAETSACEWHDDDLYNLFRGAYQYRNLQRADFDEILLMLTDGFTTRRGRRSALVHHDAIGHRIRGRRGARLAAITSGGAIPDAADYAVIQEPGGLKVGTLDEHFASESSPGDVFQLGNTTWRILKVEIARVRVEDAKGQPPNLPFWFGEAPARSTELSRQVSRQRVELERLLESEGMESAIRWLMDDSGLPRSGAEQICAYYSESKKVLGVLPNLDRIILERFFDESGGMQLVLHSPFGRRVNWAWGLALRKRFCRGFNFELQAAAAENSLLLSLGPQHSFPLADVFHYLSLATVETLLVQAMLVTPVFQTRWRWDAGRSLALLRFSGGKKVPPHLQRMRSDDLMCAVFPHAAACPENLEGDREIPDHPLVKEVIHDCLHEAMDLDALKAIIQRIDAGTIETIAKDTIEPSALAGEILAAKKYSFLDDADINERRARAVFTRRMSGSDEDRAINELDPAAIERVRSEARPEPRDPDELHDALMTGAYLLHGELTHAAKPLALLLESGRATVVKSSAGAEKIVATERLPWFEAVFPDAQIAPPVTVPESARATTLAAPEALVEIVRGRMELKGPATVPDFAEELGVPTTELDAAFLALETQGVVLRGQYTPVVRALEWCDRRLLARIHRYTLDRLRREIEPVSAQDFMRFLFRWQHVAPGAQLEGPRGVSSVVAQLQGFELAAAAWEREVLAARVKSYDRRWLDQLSLSGEIAWGRRFPPKPEPGGKPHSGQIRSAPIGLFPREQLHFWLSRATPLPDDESHLSSAAQATLSLLRKRGAMFFSSLVRETRRLPVEIETALAELVAHGWVTGDGIGGLRALLQSSAQRRSERRAHHRHAQRLLRRRRHMQPGAVANPLHQPLHLVPKNRMGSFETTGRWTLFRGDGQPDLFGEIKPDEANDFIARQLLRRWGVVFYRVVEREKGLPPWLELLRVFRRLEARGEIRGGRFVAGFSGEQYALPEAVELLRSTRSAEPTGALLALSAADPLNLVGTLLPGEKIPIRVSTRILFRDGIPVAVRESGETRILQQDTPTELRGAIDAALARRAM